jgi:hypothetical protein
MKANWNKVCVFLAFFSLTLFCMQSTEASPRVIVDQYEYQEDCISIAYPHFDGMVNEEVQDKMNAMIENLVENYIDEAQRDIEKASQYNTHYFRPVVQLNYKVWHNNDDLLSITLSSYRFFGGAHGMSALIGYTFNLQTGSVIPYNDLFLWDGQSRELAYNTILQQVNDRKIFLFKEGDQSLLVKKIKNPDYIPNFYLVEKDNPVIIFEQYEIAPYAAGILRFQLQDNNKH